MRPIEIEAWALRIIDKLDKRSPLEDARVELKREWPEPPRAARQIAGHANSSRGDSLLWLVGIDEAAGIVGASQEEIANWLPQVKAEFQAVAPEIFPVNIHHGDSVIVALHIRTDFAPYLVRIPEFGKTKGLGAQWEVPWRDGNRTRTATRSELLRLIVPKIEQPQFEILQVSASFDPSKNEIFVRQQIYVIPPRDSFYVYPKHKAFLTLSLDGRVVEGSGSLIFHSARQSEGSAARAASLLSVAPVHSSPHVTVRTHNEAVEVTATEIIVRAPGVLMGMKRLASKDSLTTNQPLKVETQFQSAHDDVACFLGCVMQPGTNREGNPGWWPQ